jgi:hypothetical protein
MRWLKTRKERAVRRKKVLGKLLVGRLSPAQPFLASVSSRSMIKIFALS